jgi:hypothetical protein
LDRVVQAAFLEIDAREVERPVGALQLLHFSEGLRGLNQLAFLAALIPFQKEPDAVIVPALPEINFRRGIGQGGIVRALHRERNLVGCCI